MTEGTMLENVEAGDYIEDDPEAWAAWLAMVREYGPQFAALSAHLGADDAAAEVIAGTVLSRLADRHGLYLTRQAPR
jgi:hypothetical protein